MSYYDPLITAWPPGPLPSGVTGTALAAGMTAAQKLAAINAWTVQTTVDTTALAVRGVLYPRGSWDRIKGVALGLYTGLSNAAVIACHNLVDAANAGDPVPYASVPGVAAKIGADLDTLAATKLTTLDGKGIIFAAGEFAVGDTGDKALLLGALTQATQPWSVSKGMTAPLTPNDLWAAGLS
jgi:hypothetical protein